jgi:hypothetical protein
VPHHGSCLSRIAVLPIIIVAALASAGCAAHRDTPRQQLAGALMRGNAAQASYIWNNMSAQDRASFRRGESTEPPVDPAAAADQLARHQAEDGAGDVPGDAPATVEIPGGAMPSN